MADVPNVLKITSNEPNELLLYTYIPVDVDGTVFREISGEADLTYY